MTRAAYLIGRILAALGALLMVATIVVTLVSIAHAGDCQGADCDDERIADADVRALVLLPISVFVGAAGVALVNDTYRKV
jgi:hypothetical protein